MPRALYSKDGAMRIDNVSDPGLLPELVRRRPGRRRPTYAEHAVWAADGEMVRAAYTLHAEDDDFGQARTLLTQVMDDDQRARLVHTVGGLLAGLRRDQVRQRAFDYWRNIDKGVGDPIEAAALEKRNG